MNKEEVLFCKMYDDNDPKLAKKYPFDEMRFRSYAVAEQSNDAGRWYAYVKTIIKMNNRYFAFDWCRGKTEMQDDDFFSSHYYEVEPKEHVVTVTDYVPKE